MISVSFPFVFFFFVWFRFVVVIQLKMRSGQQTFSCCDGDAYCVRVSSFTKEESYKLIRKHTAHILLSRC